MKYFDDILKSKYFSNESVVNLLYFTIFAYNYVIVTKICILSEFLRYEFKEV